MFNSITHSVQRHATNEEENEDTVWEQGSHVNQLQLLVDTFIMELQNCVAFTG